MRYIFLDWDGVLIPYKKKGLWGHGKISFEAVNAVNLLVDYYDAKIICSSAWRTKIKKRRYIRAILRAFGVKGEIHGFTPDLGNRGKEIKKYCKWHKIKLKNIIVIDDDLRDIKGKIKKKYIIKPVPTVGLTFKQAGKFIKENR